MPVYVASTIAGLDALAARVNRATERSVAGAAHIFQAEAMKLAPVGDPENSTNPPGDLRRSIDVDGPTAAGADTWVAQVGPTVTTVNPGRGGRIFNYGRLREFGGVVYPRASPYLAFKTFGVYVQTPVVHQKGAFYLTRARADGAAAVSALVDAEIAAAVL